MNAEQLVVQLLEAAFQAIGQPLIGAVESWAQGKKAQAPTLAQEQAAVEAAADAEARAVLK